MVKIDALNQALDKILYQANKDSKLKPVTFFSIKYLASKYNYKIYNKELLAIIKVLKKIVP